MAKSHTFLPDIAVADVAFEAWGKDLNTLFSAAAEATLEVMANPSTIKPIITKTISLSAATIENLLYDFLSEIIFLKDTEGMVFCKVSVTITRSSTYTLQATLAGDVVNPETQELGNDVKAVTLHMFKIKKLKSGYTARVVLDI